MHVRRAGLPPYTRRVRVLIIEDDERIVRFLERGLMAMGHRVVVASNGEDGAELGLDPNIEFVLLDLSLPGLDGHEVLLRIRRERPAVPILVLTARDALDEKVRSLDSGADDYLTKPFAIDELLARLRALTRRTDQPQGSELQVDDLRLDLRTRFAHRGGSAIELSTREYALLEYLMRHPGQVLTREQILAAVWQYDFDPQSNLVDVYIRYLRRKIDRPGQRSLIATIRGAGYRFGSGTSAETDH